MNAKERLNGRLRGLKSLVEGALDCVLEGQNNVERQEWIFGTTNLRKLFRNASAIQKQRATVLRLLRLARKESDERR